MNDAFAAAWTRRRFGFVALALASLFGWSPIDDNGAKGKKKCKRVTRPCNRARNCCNTLACRPVNGLSGDRCCRRDGEICDGPQDCCGFLFCAPAGRCVVPDSDRNLKDNFGSVDPLDMLQRVRSLPITAWDESGAAAIRHVGPAAKDFAVAFGVGSDDRSIHPIDGQGVTLAAIQGLASLMDDLRVENAMLAARLDALPR